jgi:hypothetical protein
LFDFNQCWQDLSDEAIIVKLKEHIL